MNRPRALQLVAIEGLEAVVEVVSELVFVVGVSCCFLPRRLLRYQQIESRLSQVASYETNRLAAGGREGLHREATS